MPKTGRNTPCPCGSGKKFKLCCGSPDATRSSVPRLLKSPARLLPDPRGLDSESIRTQLEQWGISAGTEVFRAATDANNTANAVAEEWLDAIPPAATDAVDEDFVFGAAIELWRRERPDRPSMEMLSDDIDAGCELAGQDRLKEACDTWFEVWEVVRDRLTPSIRTTLAADRELGWDVILMNLLGDLQNALLDVSERDRDYAARGVRFSQEVLEQFDAEPGEFFNGFRADFGDLLALAGRLEEAERVHLDLIAANPRESRGYCHLAGLYRKTDPHRALTILEQARAVPVEDGADYDLDVRIADLRRYARTRADAEPETRPDESPDISG